MNGWSKETIVNIVKTDIINIRENRDELITNIDASYNETLDYFRRLLEQVPRAISGPLIPKTPKVPRKKDVNCIETIPEDDVVHDTSKASTVLVQESKIEEDEDTVPARRSRRVASQKALMNMKKQQSISLITKLRRPSSDDEEDASIQDKTRPSRVKSEIVSSDEEELKRSSTYSRTQQRLYDMGTMKTGLKVEPDETYVASVNSKEEEETITAATARPSRNKRPRGDSNETSGMETRKRPSKKSQEPAAKRANEMMDIPDNMDVTLYEDAVGKSIPINLTENRNTIDRKMINATVVLDPIPMPIRINETVTIKKSTSSQGSRRSTLVNEEPTKNNFLPESPLVSKTVVQSTNSLQNRMKALKETMTKNAFDVLITDDESSPERHEEITSKKRSKRDKNNNKTSTRSRLASDDNDDAVVANPAKTVLRPGGLQTRVTDAQKAARKSLSKAKKISLMKQMKENDEGKENNVMYSAQKSSGLATNDQLAQKQQEITTPVGKSRLQMPMPVDRIHHTGSQIVNQNKAFTASKANIVTSLDWFLEQPKTLTKSKSNDSLTEKKRKVTDEDARRKRDDALKAITEEKRRKREKKEVKNKLANEAKEKLDMEKRIKQEREREENARAAQLLQERQREESEKKRLLQLQKAQEKEDRRRQEEAERQLAEQKRRAQEAESRRLHEARAEQLAEAARMEAHYLAKAKLAASKNQQGPISYKLESDPDDDASEDESRPKHIIPYWAQPNLRKTQVAIQRYIPIATVLQFFGAKRCTPDLRELFKGIKKERLQRTSSAIWKTPPRYSMMINEYSE